MKNNKLKISLVGLVALLGFIGCGESEQSSLSGTKDVTVERGKVYDALVTDSSTPQQIAVQKMGENIYTFSSIPTYPVSATGGWIDVNNNGIKDAKDAVLDLVLSSYSSVITPITSYIADEDAKVRESRLQSLVQTLNIAGIGSDEVVTPQELLGVASQADNLDVVLLINAIYKEMEENNGDLSYSNEYNIFSQFASIQESGSTFIEIESAVVGALVDLGFVEYISTKDSE